MVKKSFICLALLLLLCVARGEASTTTTNSPSEADYDITLTNTAGGKRTTIFPLQWADIYVFLVIMIFAGLANAGGIGGGSAMTCVLIVLLNYNENDAIEVVYALVFGGSLGNYLNLATKRDPKTKKPLTEYDLALISMPLMLIGAIVGVMINRIIAAIITLIGLFMVLGYGLIRLSIKARAQWANESKLKAKETPSESFSTRRESELELTRAIFSQQPDVIEPEPIVSDELKAVLQEDQALFPVKKLWTNIALLIIIVLLVVMRGSEKTTSFADIEFCSGPYWALLGVIALICVMCLVYNIWWIKKPMLIKQQSGIVTAPGRFELQTKDMPQLVILSAVAGVLTGLVGAGGGLVMGPTMLTMGVPPQGLSATSGFFIVQTAFISLVQAIVFKDVPIQDQGFFLVLSAVGSFAVSYTLDLFVKKYKRPSLILFTLMFVISISLLGTLIFEVVTNIHDASPLLTFHPVCPAPSG